jgi:hypothetical protein
MEQAPLDEDRTLIDMSSRHSIELRVPRQLVPTFGPRMASVAVVAAALMTAR